ncbi:hypothetical protein VNO77_10670 [Canavalia gladiata]|uniref:Uncharacterized protein n=1 Tax=Canavalia gladiata TaxID=3824 RepID=A0AAN9QX94_CANGL
MPKYGRIVYLPPERTQVKLLVSSSTSQFTVHSSQFTLNESAKSRGHIPVPHLCKRDPFASFQLICVPFSTIFSFWCKLSRGDCTLHARAFHGTSTAILSPFCAGNQHSKLHIIA